MRNVPTFENGIKIESVGEFLAEIKRINEANYGSSTELFFRGQEVEFWDIKPSIFRDNMLSIEHKLMQTPLQKLPFEFRDMRNEFEIMTKYQHYGMCTRLLDLTTNPLVALYFACKSHGKEKYNLDGVEESKEPFGIVYLKKDYPISADNINVKIITALSMKDLSKENTLKSTLDYLNQKRIIEDEQYKKWLKEEFVEDFIKLIQGNYLVMPSYSNERLTKQSGAFLLSGLFSFTRDDSLQQSIITKCEKNLRNEFEDDYFYIDGQDKDDILKELDWYNINESTLFPELEHQLNHIREKNKIYTEPVASFEVGDLRNTVGSQAIILHMSATEQAEFDKNLLDFVSEKVGSEIGHQIFDSLSAEMTVDWYKQDSIKSKMKMSIKTALKKTEYSPKSEEIAKAVVKYMVEEYTRKANDCGKS